MRSPTELTAFVQHRQFDSGHTDGPWDGLDTPTSLSIEVRLNILNPKANLPSYSHATQSIGSFPVRNLINAREFDLEVVSRLLCSK